MKHFRIDISTTNNCLCRHVRNGHNSIVSTMECVDTFFVCSGLIDFLVIFFEDMLPDGTLSKQHMF